MIEAPPRPPKQSPTDLDALIEEARGRARRRRLKRAAAVLGAAVLGGAAFGTYALVDGGSPGSPVPPGYELVQARGSVEHALIEVYDSSPTVLIDARTGSASPAKVIWEAWFDRKSGLERVRSTVAGVEQFDVSGRTQCFAAGHGSATTRVCLPPGSPFDLKNRGFTWPLRTSSVRRIGRGTFRGRSVIWAAELTNGKLQPNAERVALDARTHRLVDYRQPRGRGFPYEQVYLSIDAVPGEDVPFVVRKGQQVTHTWPPIPSLAVEPAGEGLAAANRVLGRTPLWVGRTYGGRVLRRVRAERFGSVPGGAAMPSVTFEYGTFALRETRAGDEAYAAQPPPGKILMDARIAGFVRGGIFVQATPVTSPHQAIEIMNALRTAPEK